MSARKIHKIRRKLLTWYDRTHRILPWRNSKNPYAIWIAEIMLQQTQVNTVLPYYHQFMSTLPTLRSLHKARRDKVLSLWSGLGYYRRAENLKKSARQIMQQHGGQLPKDYTKLLKLPGVGPYTAGALMSIAFHQPYPALDGNASRILQRIFGVNQGKTINDLGYRLVSPRRPGHFNQALMELGSRVCLPRNPYCSLCPLSTVCLTASTGFMPKKGPVKRIINMDWPLAFICEDGKILLRRRVGKGILKGLWEVPGGEKQHGETLKSALIRHVKGSGYRIEVKTIIGKFRHNITNYRIRAFLFFASRGKSSRLPTPGWRWVSLSQLHRYPLSSFTLKAIIQQRQTRES